MPAIISADVWNRVRARMRVNKSGRHRAKEPYLLSGLIFCGKCGNLMTGNSRGVELKYYYECSGKKRLRECDAQGIERDQIENIVIEYLEDLLSKDTLDSVATWIAENARLYRKNAATESKIIQRELAAVTKEAEILLDKIMSGLDSELARQRLADAEARKLHLEIKLSDIMGIAESAQGVTKTDVRLYLSQLKGIRQKERHEQAKTIRLFIARIEMHPADNNGERQLKITTKLDKLLDNKRMVKVELSIRHYYPHGTPYFIEQTVILGSKKEPRQMSGLLFKEAFFSCSHRAFDYAHRGFGCIYRLTSSHARIFEAGILPL